MNNHSMQINAKKVKCNERDSRTVWKRREGAAGESSPEGRTPNLTREHSR